MIRAFNLDDEVIAKLDTMEKGERSRRVNEILKQAFTQAYEWNKSYKVKIEISDEIRKLVREELQGLDIKEKPAEKVSDDIQEKVKKTMGGILEMRKGMR